MSKMYANEYCLLVSSLICVTLSTAIRVDWNTNKGPIVPPTPRTTSRPQPPFREPAPVWEDQSNDIPNPNPYVYVQPPPSRPRPATNNYLTSSYHSNSNSNINSNHNYNNYGQLVVNGGGNGNTVVASLSPKYIPNVGFKYIGVVPSTGAGAGTRPTVKYPSGAATGAFAFPNGGYTSTAAVNANGVSGGGDKLQGKYNAKTKKYKAYEKSKYVPLNYYPLFEYALPGPHAYLPEFQSELLMRQQQLPLQQQPQIFRAIEHQQQQHQQQQTRLAHDKDIADKSKYLEKTRFSTPNGIWQGAGKGSS